MNLPAQVDQQFESIDGDISSGEIMLNAPLLEQIDQMAKRMASAKATIPKHLAASEGDCWAVIMQAIQWRMNPFAVAQKTHIVNGTLGYEAQLVNAVVQNSGLVKGPFHYEYQGDGQALQCRVGAVVKGESDIRWGQWLCIDDVKVQNSPLWKTNPRQQLGYLQVKNWARAYCPGAILGVYTPDELQDIQPRGEREIGPAVSDLNAALAKRVESSQEEAVVVDDKDPPPADAAPIPEEPETEELPLAAELTYADVADQLNKASTPDQLSSAVATMADFIGIEGNEQFKDELTKLYQHRLSQLKGEKKSK